MKRLWPFFIFLPAALLLLALGIWIDFPAWLIAVIVAIPLLLGILAGLLGRRGREPKPDDKYEISTQGAHSVGRLDLAVPQGQVEVPFKAAIAESPRLKVRSIDTDGAELDAALNWKTWGLVLSAEFESIDETRTRIVATTRPKLAATVTDWGQGSSDIRDLFEALERQVEMHQGQR